MKKFVTSMILLLMLLSLSTSTFAHGGHAPYINPDGTSVEHEHKVTSIYPQQSRHYRAVGRGPFIGHPNNQEIPVGLVLVRYNPTNETIKDTLYKFVPWKNEYLKSPTIAFPNDLIEDKIRRSGAYYSNFRLPQIGHIWQFKYDYEIPPGKTLALAMYNEYHVLRVNLHNTYTIPAEYSTFGEFTISSSGHALVKKYNKTHVDEYLVDGEFTEEQIVTIYPPIIAN